MENREEMLSRLTMMSLDPLGKWDLSENDQAALKFAVEELRKRGQSACYDQVRPPQEHDLKTWPDPFNAMWRGDKNFEVRKNDRDFQVGDTLKLRWWNPKTGRYSERWMKKKVTYILHGPCFGIEKGYCIMAVA